MEKILDKVIIYICCSIFLLSNGMNIYSSIPLLIAIVFSSFATAFKNPAIKIGAYILFVILMAFYPNITYFIPLMCYDLYCEPFRYVTVVAIFPIFFNFTVFPRLGYFWISIITLLVLMLKYRTTDFLEAKKQYVTLKDDTIESTNQLNLKNKELLEKQDYEITNATLNERNRIAREIHDSVGHLLSSSILQIGALLAITKDELVKENLTNIKDTLSTGMDSIRTSIHNLHEESMDLNSKLSEIVKNFTFCEVNYTYKISSDFCMKAKYTILFVVKEALSNVMKHSNATKVTIIITELPSFYQIKIEDNGTISRNSSLNNGMGMSSISDRVSSLNGNINITRKNGYKIFITLPKEDFN